MRRKRDLSWSDREMAESGEFRCEATLPCLVVGASESRRAMLCQAAKVGGWMPICCSEVPSAVAQFERVRLRLVIVDLHNPAGRVPAELRWLLEWFATKRDLLIVICGRDGDSREEIWARQLGPWLYLTGDLSASDLSVHLRAARQQAIPTEFVELHQ